MKNTLKERELWWVDFKNNKNNEIRILLINGYQYYNNRHFLIKLKFLNYKHDI